MTENNHNGENNNMYFNIWHRRPLLSSLSLYLFLTCKAISSGGFRRTIAILPLSVGIPPPSLSPPLPVRTRYPRAGWSGVGSAETSLQSSVRHRWLWQLAPPCFPLRRPHGNQMKTTLLMASPCASSPLLPRKLRSWQETVTAAETWPLARRRQCGSWSRQ